ncbi:hypothetical protein [Vibrio phage V-YDF132]|nr:hypothetical protein [Vibrio phage V-YDF132]
MITKTQQAVTAFKANDFKLALKIFSSFRANLTATEKATLKRGYEALVNPQFYEQLGKNPKTLVSDACILAYSKFVKGN